MKQKSKYDEFMINETECKCPICGAIYNKKTIGYHMWRMHSEEGQNHKPLKGKKAWNAGLSKENDVRVNNHSKSIKKSFKEGKITPSFKGKHHSDETKERISKSRIDYLIANPDQVPYKLNHSSKMSYPEKIFMNALIESEIVNWEYNYPHGIYSYDFAFVDLKIDVEIDGETHLTDKVKQIDEKRDKFSKEAGWKVIRFTAKEVKTNVLKCIKILKNNISVCGRVVSESE